MRSQDNASYRLGADFLAAMKAIRRDGAHLMDQAIRFTVLDPLTTRLERHDHLRVQIAQWRRLQQELEEVQLALDFQRATRQDKEERRQRNEARLAALHQQLEPLETELLRSLGGYNVTATYHVHCTHLVCRVCVVCASL
ncbi:hypothetical protein PINS_up002492 [Pythium insidiosum]|nr:hypothetical protein PINS_up002492 [Pythium insidiosum]